MKKVLIIAIFLAISATPVLAQSYDPQLGTGNVHSGYYGGYYEPYGYYRWRPAPYGYGYGYAYPYRYAYLR